MFIALRIEGYLHLPTTTSGQHIVYIGIVCQNLIPEEMPVKKFLHCE